MPEYEIVLLHEGKTQDIEEISNLFRNECQGCSETPSFLFLVLYSLSNFDFRLIYYLILKYSPPKMVLSHRTASAVPEILRERKAENE